MHGRQNMLHDSTRSMIARAIMAKSRRTCLLQTSTFILNSVEVDGDDHDEEKEDPQDDEDEAFIDDHALSELSIDDWMQYQNDRFQETEEADRV